MCDFYEGYVRAGKIKKGDIVDVASDLLSLMIYFRKNKMKFDADQLINSLQEAVGPDGTILIRCFNWDFCHDVPFDIKHTPSRVGSLGNFALKRDDFRRTRHPLYSWCVWGKYQDKLVEMDPVDSFGDDSIFAFLEDHDAWLLRIGDTSVSCLTSLHRSEQRAGIALRFIKNFTGDYINEYGKCETRTYSMFVRNLDYNIRVREEIMNQRMIDKEALEVYEFQGLPLSKIRLKVVDEAIYEDILAGKWSDWVECSKLETK